ncbi:MAG: DUF423 domain-containing protein [Porticoccaceae bacterium]|nr:DUF423 domain-containing protein [Porticoccaceae bacterium]
MSKAVTIIAAILGFSGVALGAFGAHGLKAVVSPAMLEVWKTAVSYQMYHVAPILLLGLFPAVLGSKARCLASICFVAGVLIFSGSLYALVVFDIPLLGMVTPVGGGLLLLGWLTLTIGFATRTFEP